MARAITQTIAWGLATVMAGVVFAGGYGVFKIITPKDGAHSGGHGSSHANDGHKQSGDDEGHGSSGGHAEHGDSHGSGSSGAGHEPTAPASEKAHGDAHGDSHGENHGDGHNAAESKSHEVKTKGKKAAAHGEEEEISADQFKKNDEHH